MVRDACCALAVVVGLTGTVQAGQRPVDTPLPLRSQTVAILPFVNISDAAADQWFGTGIAETLATDLQRAAGITVIHGEALTRALRARTGADPEAVDEAVVLGICRELGATQLIAGAYQRLGDRVRITARLLAVETGAVVHTVKVDGVVGDLFGLQDQMVDALGTQLGIAGDLPRRAAMDDASPVDRPEPAPASPVPPEAARPAGSGVGPPPSTIPMPTRTGRSGTLPQAVDGPPPPVEPEVITRDALNRATVRAVRLITPLALDGQLDEAVYTRVPAMSDFIQQEPLEGSPATERTDVWMFFDDERVYLSFRCWESEPDRLIVNEMRRDNFGVYQNDHIAFVLDTFYDRRNGMEFLVNPVGGRMDGQITNERLYNGDWNPVWDVAVGQFDGGWTLETAIPFKSIRYRRGTAQLWGFNVRRVNVWKNEHSFLVGIPSALGDAGIFQLSRAATVVGLEVPPRSTNLDIKPFAITDLTSDRTVTPPVDHALGGDVGLDVKYGVTQNLVADLTVNTDFAQVEADEQQINLTRFSLFFPEKREFFLENQGVFAFGGAGAGPFGGGGTTPVLFYSRRIGLHEGQEVPITVGGRLTGRTGAFSVGALNIQTDDAPAAGAAATNFTVVRVKRDLLRRSSIGAIFTGRSVSTQGGGSSETYGVDGTFAFFDSLRVNTYWARTDTSGLAGDDRSYRAQVDYAGDRYGVQVERLVVGDDFNPDVGFLQRDDFERSFGYVRFSPRPQSISAIRKFSWEGRLDYFTDRAGVVETRQQQGVFGILFENTDQLTATYTRSYEFLDRPFPIAPDVTIPVGGYNFQDVELSYLLGQQRRLAGRVAVQHGSFFGGTKTTVIFGSGGFVGGRLELTPQLSVEPGLSLNWIDLPEGTFTTELVTARTTYTVTPLMFVSALVQYNSGNNSLGANIRFRWEYQPGSELFVVYNEQRDTLTPRYPELQNRSVVIKINRLFRF